MARFKTRHARIPGCLPIFTRSATYQLGSRVKRKLTVITKTLRWRADLCIMSVHPFYSIHRGRQTDLQSDQYCHICSKLDEKATSWKSFQRSIYVIPLLWSKAIVHLNPSFDPSRPYKSKSIMQIFESSSRRIKRIRSAQQGKSGKGYSRFK